MLMSVGGSNEQLRASGRPVNVGSSFLVRVIYEHNDTRWGYQEYTLMSISYAAPARIKHSPVYS